MQYERQSEKQEVEELLDKVDTDLKDIWGFLSKSVSYINVFVASCLCFILCTQQPKVTVQEVPDDYDRVVRELTFERRGQPTDKMKTEMEKEEETSKKLQRLEVNDQFMEQENDKFYAKLTHPYLQC